MRSTRRAFLADVGKGMLIAGLGPALVADLGLGKVHADDGPDTLTFGKLEPLVVLMQETPADKLLAALAQRLRDGTDLVQLTAAAALANARSFGGEDYIGFHTIMALAPAYHMSREMPEDRQALPVFKVIYRNTTNIQNTGARKHEVLHPVQPAELPKDQTGGEVLRDAVRRKDVKAAEQTFAALARGKPEDAFNQLLPTVEDDLEVHRVVLPARAWDLLGIIGMEHAHTLLRQSVRYCVKQESPSYSGTFGGARAVLPKLLDQYKLPGRTPGKKEAEDAWIDKTSQAIFRSKPDEAAEVVAAALAEGFAPDVVGEALSLAANQLILRDSGRPANQTSANKPVGSVHGDSIGVHGCDSANAWRNMARVADPRNAVACLILGAYQVSFDRTNRGGDFLTWEMFPHAEDREKVKSGDAAVLLRDAEAAIKDKDQARVCALIARYGAEGHPHRAAFDLLLHYAVSEDGALHAEKYYRTTSEEFAATRPAFRWRQAVALARVTASAYGQPAPGYADACQLLKT